MVHQLVNIICAVPLNLGSSCIHNPHCNSILCVFSFYTNPRSGLSWASYLLKDGNESICPRSLVDILDQDGVLRRRKGSDFLKVTRESCFLLLSHSAMMQIFGYILVSSVGSGVRLGEG
jgi:hypothetical protein